MSDMWFGADSLGNFEPSTGARTKQQCARFIERLVREEGDTILRPRLYGVIPLSPEAEETASDEMGRRMADDLRENGP